MALFCMVELPIHTTVKWYQSVIVILHPLSIIFAPVAQHFINGIQQQHPHFYVCELIKIEIYFKIAMDDEYYLKVHLNHYRIDLN